jgi:hypothetical protein
MKKTFLSAFILLATVSAILAQPTNLEEWKRKQPEAYQTLGQWVKVYPEAAAILFEWDASHPGKSQEFTKFCVERKGENLGVFVKAHEDWPLVHEFIIKHQDAAEEFLKWCRARPAAAKALVMHSGGLRWAGENLYKDYLKPAPAKK